MEPPTKRNPFCHVVIPAPDLEKARSFYEHIFGWKTRVGFPGANYWLFESGNVSGAFDGKRTPAAKAITLLIRVDDLPAILDRIVERGGKVIQAPGRIGEAGPGRDAYFLDPNGNEMGLYSER